MAPNFGFRGLRFAFGLLVAAFLALPSTTAQDAIATGVKHPFALCGIDAQGIHCGSGCPPPPCEPRRDGAPHACSGNGGSGC